MPVTASASAKPSGSGCGSALLSFGGPAGQIAVMHRILVEEKNWISESRFLHALNYCMLLPGPEAQQLATYIGWLLHRTAGGIMAGGLFILPGVIAIMGLSYIYAAFGHVGVVEALFFGLKAAVLAIVIQAVVRIGKPRAAQPRHDRAGGASPSSRSSSSTCPSRSSSSPPARSAISAPGADGRNLPPWRMAGGKNAAAVDSLLGDEMPDHVRPSMPRALKVAAVWLLLWLVPVGALLIAFGAGQCVQPDRAVLQQDGDGDLRRRLCRAGLCRAAGGRVIITGWGRAKCWTGSAWPRPRRAR